MNWSVINVYMAKSELVLCILGSKVPNATSMRFQIHEKFEKFNSNLNFY